MFGMDGDRKAPLEQTHSRAEPDDARANDRDRESSALDHPETVRTAGRRVRTAVQTMVVARIDAAFMVVVLSVLDRLVHFTSSMSFNCHDLSK
jgi:hypothetical protein